MTYSVWMTYSVYLYIIVAILLRTLNVGGEVDVIDNCDPDKWSKVEIEGICRDFGYTSVSRLWYTMPGMNQEMENFFHLVINDDDAMYMTKLVKGYEEIHVYVEHPIDDHLLVDEGEDVSKGV